MTFRSLIVVSLLWSAMLIASSYFLRGFAAGEWVDAILYLSAGVWFSTYLLRRRSAQCLS